MDDVTRLDDKLAEIDMSQALPFALLHADDAVTVILYKPHAVDTQDPHDQDELYFVARGTATFRVGDRTTAVAAGDAAFVPANAEHRFESPSEDFACWALFYGPRQPAA